jgi:hypothetical protein
MKHAYKKVEFYGPVWKKMSERNQLESNPVQEQAMP